MSKKLLLLVFYISFFAPCVLAQNNGQNASGPCDKVYKTAIRFVVDTPTAHYFSVNPTGGKVIFSRGNLQYCPGKDEWRFALRQFDRCGDGKQAVTPSGLNQTPGYGNTTVFYDSIDYSTKDPTTKSGFREISGIPCNNLLNSKHYNGWIDLFPWATSGHGGKVKDKYACFFYPYEWNYKMINATYNQDGYGPSFDRNNGSDNVWGPGATSNNIDKLSGTNQYFDWGYYNIIREYSGCTHSNKGALLHAHDSTMYHPGTWRTLTNAEWKYLLRDRIVANNDSAFSYVRVKYGENATDTVTCLLIYPDDFTFVNAGVTAIPFGVTRTVTHIDIMTYLSLEQEGVVFLPIAGALSRLERKQESVGITGYYWTASAYNRANAHRMYFSSPRTVDFHDVNADGRNGWYSVRLVQDVE